MNLREPLHILRTALSARKTANIALVAASYALSCLTRQPFAWGVPPVLMIEPTSACNLRCPLCPTGSGTLRRPRGFMDLDRYRRIIDEVRGRSHMVLLWNQGEPFLARDLIAMVRYAADARLYTVVSTNGHFLENPDAVVRSGLDSLIVSLDGATEETYRQYRIGGRFETVIAGVKALVAAKRRLGARFPLIHLQFIIFRHNEHEIAEVHRLAAELGVDKVTLKTAQIASPDDVATFLPERAEYRRYEVEGDSFRMRTGASRVPDRCRKLWLGATINQDGTLVPCCFDKHGDYPLGRAGESEPLARLWNGPAFNAFRRRVMTDRAAIAMCRNCTEGIRLNYAERDVRIR